jgi:hypothetical protein
MEHYEINVYYLIIAFKKADFKCKSDIVKFSEQSVGRRWKTAFLGEDLEDRLTPEAKSVAKR